MALKAVTFDLGNTLAEDLGHEELFRACAELAEHDAKHAALLMHTLRQTAAWFVEAMKTQRERSFPQALSAVVKERSYEMAEGEYDALVKRLGEMANERAVLFPETADVLSQLRKRGLKIGMVSNMLLPGTCYADVLERFGIRDHFDALVFSSDIGFRKPNPKIFEQALKELGVAPNETIHVGDLLSRDVDGAHAADIRAVWLNRHSDADEQKGGIPDWTVEDLTGLLTIVEEIQET